MKPTLYLLDAFALIYRAYYAFIRNPRISSKGENMNALYGFTMTLFDIIQKRKPDYIAVVFDPPEGNFRSEIYEDYKANREKAPEDILATLPHIFELLQVLAIPAISVAGYEADDVIGALAQQGESKGLQVFMVTPDKDYAQLVTDNSHMLRPGNNGFEEWGPAEVCQKFSIGSPKQMIDYLGLVGDSSDNIPGCRGIGEKTAAILLESYPSIDAIYENLDKLAPSIRKKLEENKEETLLSKQLVTIETKLPEQFDIADLSLKRQESEAIVAILEKFEFSSLVKRHFPNLQKGKQTSLFKKEAPAKQEKEQQESEIKRQRGLFEKEAPSKKEEQQQEAEIKQQRGLFDEPDEQEKGENLVPHEVSFEKHPPRYEIIETHTQREQLWKRLSEAKVFAFDTETDGLDALSCQIVGASFSPAPGEAYYLPLPVDKAEATAVLAPLSELMCNTKVLKVAQNAKFDTEVLSRYRVAYPTPLFDTLIAHYLISSERHHDLDSLAMELLQYKMIPYSALSEKKNFSLRQDVPLAKLAQYAAEDADVTQRIYPILNQRLIDQNSKKLFEEVEMPLIAVLKEIEERGVRIDLEILRKAGSGLEEEAERLAEKIFDEAGESFNINSPTQVGEILFSKLKIDKKPKKTKSGGFATGEKILQKYLADYPIVDNILQHRGLLKLLNTYIKALPTFVHHDGKIHASFNQAIAVTGRLSSSNPNLQNIPIRTTIGQELRAAFVPSDTDYTFLSADYSQIELRILAHISGDKALIEAFNRGVDIHRETAARIYSLPLDEVNTTQRSFAKTANFGIIYGISSFGLSQRLHISRKVAEELIENYFLSFPDVAKYMETAIENAIEKGYAETLLGRRRYLPDIYSANHTVRSFAERTAINTPIQGTAADLIKVAMVRIAERMKAEKLKSSMIMQVHDELNFDAYKPEVERLKAIVVEEMSTALGNLSVPLEVSIGMGNNWLEAH